MSVVYLNGEFIPKAQATVSVDDRGFLLSDGVYEVTAAYGGKFFRMDTHMERLRAGLEALRIVLDVDGVPELHRRLLDENGLGHDPSAIVYLQVTRGVAPRTHAFPSDPVPPTVYAFAVPFLPPPMERWEQGYKAITLPDRRWTRVDLKTISLLPNVLAQQAAVDAGVQDAIFVRDGVALEGTHSNVFYVFGDTVTTYPANNLILNGITRRVVLEVARELGYEVEERAVQVEELAQVDEIFFTGTTTEVKPTVELDGRPVGTGSVGPVSRALLKGFRALVDREIGQESAG